MFRTATLGTAEFACCDAQARHKTDLLVVQRVSKLVCERHQVPIIQESSPNNQTPMLWRECEGTLWSRVCDNNETQGGGAAP